MESEAWQLRSGLDPVAPFRDVEDTSWFQGILSHVDSFTAISKQQENKVGEPGTNASPVEGCCGDVSSGTWNTVRGTSGP